MIIGDRLKDLRNDKKLMKKEVAEALGISVSCYGGYEQGYRKPDLKTLIKLCRFFDVSSDYLLGIEE